MSTSLLLTTLFMLFYLSSALVAVVGTGGAWALDNLDDGRLGLLYWMLAVLGILNFVGVPLLREPARVQARRRPPRRSWLSWGSWIELRDLKLFIQKSTQVWLPSLA